MSDETVPRLGARQLRHELSAILDRVWDGETFEVTDRGKPVARLVPIPERATAWDRLIADGVIIPAKRSPYPLPNPVRTGKRLMSTDRAIAIQHGYEDVDDLP